MTREKFKDLIDIQRRILVSLKNVIPEFKQQEINDLIDEDLDMLWETTEIIEKEYGLKLATSDDILKHAGEVLYLKRLYELETN